MTRLMTLASIVVLASAEPVSANTEIRVATLAPAGSPWMTVLSKGQSEIREATAGRVTLTYYDGGQQGDERDLIRKMGTGQLDAAAITSVGLAMIDESIRVLELPMMFASVEEVDHVAGKMWPYFQRKFDAKGYTLHDRGEVGWLYLMSKDSVDSISALERQRMWGWADDRVFNLLYRKLGLSLVPLGVPDVDAALATDKVTACYASPLVAVSLQWASRVRVMSSMPVSFAIAATVFSNKSLAALSVDDRRSFERIARATQSKLRKVIRKANDDARTAMLKRGVRTSTTPPAMVADVERAAHAVWKELAGKLYSHEELEMVLRYRDEFRARKDGTLAAAR